MASFKIDRLQEDILRELTAIMREDIKDPRITPDLTIVRAELSGDMGHCKAYISSLTDLSRAEEACKVLTKASGFIRRELFHRLKGQQDKGSMNFSTGVFREKPRGRQ